MQWIAMLTMLIDHIGVVFYDDSIIFRMIGRLAFPLYVYLLVLGYKRTSNVKRYVIRLTILALLSQIPFQLAFNTTSINVIFTLLICLFAMICIDYVKPLKYVSVPITILFAILLDYFPFDYGAYGLALALIYRYCLTKPVLLLFWHIVLELMYFYFFGASIQVLALLITLFLIIYSQASTSPKLLSRAPKWLWRLFYPLHLVSLYLFVRFM